MFPDFSRPAWRSLSAADRAAASAAAGVLGRHQDGPLIEGTGRDASAAGMSPYLRTGPLRKASSRPRGDLSWSEPRFLADVVDRAWLEALAVLSSTFLRDESGKRPVYGGTRKFQDDPHWRALVLFYEYFHGDNGAGLGASHQTGWTGLIAPLMDIFARADAQALQELDRERLRAQVVTEQVGGQRVAR